MKVIKILIVITFSILSLTTNANFNYQYGDTLEVWATSGLNMREGPGTDFPKITKLEYGTQVEVIDNYIQSTPLDLNVFKRNKKTDAFTMHGFWVRVKIGRQEGYVFDGYLSRLPVINIENGWCEDLLKYTKREFNILDEQQEDNGYGYTLNCSFEKNIILFKREGKFGANTFTIPNISKNEAFVFFNIVLNWKYWSSDKELEMLISKYNITTNSNNELKVNIGAENCYFSLEYKNGIAVISKSCSC